MKGSYRSGHEGFILGEVLNSQGISADLLKKNIVFNPFLSQRVNFSKYEKILARKGIGSLQNVKYILKQTFARTWRIR